VRVKLTVYTLARVISCLEPSLGVFDLQTTLIGCVDKGVKPAERLSPNYVRMKLARRAAKFWHGRQRQPTAAVCFFAWLFAPSRASLNKLSFAQRISVFFFPKFTRGPGVAPSAIKSLS